MVVTRWLVASSCLFLLPSWYAFSHQLYFYSALLACTSAISVNYWRDATDSWRRNLDLVFSKIAFVVFVYQGIVHVRYIPYIVTGYSGLFFLVRCYHTSGRLWEQKIYSWYLYHCAFHVLLTYEQFIVLDSIVFTRHHKITE